jgi:hypothetical protein
MKKESGSRAQDMQPTYYLKPGRLDELLKNRPKRSPAIFCQNYYMTFNLEKSRQKLWPSFVIKKKTAQRKQSPNSRKFDQRGHPAYSQCMRQKMEVLF